MNIVNKEPGTIKFGDVSLGECFEAEGRIYMKMLSISGYNAVCLIDGIPWNFEIDAKIILHEGAKVIIR